MLISTLRDVHKFKHEVLVLCTSWNKRLRSQPLRYTKECEKPYQIIHPVKFGKSESVFKNLFENMTGQLL